MILFKNNYLFISLYTTWKTNDSRQSQVLHIILFVTISKNCNPCNWTLKKKRMLGILVSNYLVSMTNTL